MRSVLPDLSIRQLEYLVAVDTSPTWAIAAERVGVSASALSQGLAELEKRVGIVLFDRAGRRRVLRPTARPVLEHAQQLIALTGDLARWSQRTRDADQGEIRLGMIDAAAVHHFPHILRSFRDNHPDLDFHLRVAPSADLLNQLLCGQLDLVICVQPITHSQMFDVRPLLTENLAIYRPGTNKLGPISSWGPWVLFPEGSNTRSVIEAALRGEGAAVEVVAESHQPDVLREMVQLNLGWTVLPVIQAEQEPQALIRGRILTKRELVTVTRSGATSNPAADALRAALENS